MLEQVSCICESIYLISIILYLTVIWLSGLNWNTHRVKESQNGNDIIGQLSEVLKQLKYLFIINVFTNLLEKKESGGRFTNILKYT